MDVDVEIALNEFAIDVKFDKILHELLLSYQKKGLLKSLDNSTTRNQCFRATLFFLLNEFVPLIESFINENCDMQTKDWLIRDIKFRYKLESSKVDYKEGDLNDFKSYLQNIKERVYQF